MPKPTPSAAANTDRTTSAVPNDGPMLLELAATRRWMRRRGELNTVTGPTPDENVVRPAPTCIRAIRGPIDNRAPRPVKDTGPILIPIPTIIPSRLLSRCVVLKVAVGDLKHRQTQAAPHADDLVPVVEHKPDDVAIADVPVEQIALDD